MICADQFRQLKKKGAVLMVENRPSQNILTQATLILRIAIVSFPIYIALVASTHEARNCTGYTFKMLVIVFGYGNEAPVDSHQDKNYQNNLRRI